MIDAGTMIYGIIGDPVSHSLSPVIHNSFFETEGINGAYAAFKVEKKDLEKAVRGAASLGIRGLNVTVPHKENIIPLLSETDPEAEKIGAVNTLSLTEKGYKGYNTDCTGIKRAITENGFNIENEKVILLGAGGAANAVLTALYSLGAKGAYILNRTPEKAEKKFGGDKRNTILPLDGFGKIPGKGYFCVQCTSAGLHPHNDIAPVYEDAFYEKIDRAMDIIYSPSETLFMKKVRNKGGKAVNGLDMLLFQAVESFYHFTGVRVSEEGIRTAEEKLRKALWEE